MIGGKGCRSLVVKLQGFKKKGWGILNLAIIGTKWHAKVKFAKVKCIHS